MSDQKTDNNVVVTLKQKVSDTLATVALMPVTRLVSRPSLQVVNGQLVAVRAIGS